MTCEELEGKFIAMVPLWGRHSTQRRSRGASSGNSCCENRARSATVSSLLTILIVLTVAVQIILQYQYLPNPTGSNEYIPSSPAVLDSAVATIRKDSTYGNPYYQQQPQLYSCSDLFGRDQIIKVKTKVDGLKERDTGSANDTSTNKHNWLKSKCIQHSKLQWMSCSIGSVRFNQTQIKGSDGGEFPLEVKNRHEKEELLRFEKGSLVLVSSNGESRDSIIPREFQQSIDQKLGGFLRSAVIDSVEKDEPYIPQQDPPQTLLLVRRGNYANPCMAILTMYNVFIVMTYFDLLAQSRQHDHRPGSSIPKIVWLDGHARGDLDDVWQHLFQTRPSHLKQYENDVTDSDDNNDAIVVNTMSAIGDEGYGSYDWNSRCDYKSSTLIDFRDFVLERYGLQQSNQSDTKQILTLLIRNDFYVSHPRSNGHTDRTMANVTNDVNYLQTLYPEHEINVVSFEGMGFKQQLLHITQTDIFVAVHGAGNIHVLFLPPGSTFIEFVPKTFEGRKRFRFLAACLPNIHYESQFAWTSHKDPKDGKISVQLSPPF